MQASGGGLAALGNWLNQGAAQYKQQETGGGYSAQGLAGPQGVTTGLANSGKSAASIVQNNVGLFGGLAVGGIVTVVLLLGAAFLALLLLAKVLL